MMMVLQFKQASPSSSSFMALWCLVFLSHFLLPRWNGALAVNVDGAGREQQEVGEHLQAEHQHHLAGTSTTKTLLLRRGAGRELEPEGRSKTTLDNFNKEDFDPADPDSAYFLFGFPPIGFVGDDGDAETSSSCVVLEAAPQAKTVPLGPLGGLDHVKRLQYRKETFIPTEHGKVTYDLKMSGSASFPDPLPAIFSDGVSNPDDDIRLGGIGMNAIDLDTFIVADFFLSNTGIWALNERLPFGWGIPPLEPSPGVNYAAYSQVFKVGERT